MAKPFCKATMDLGFRVLTFINKVTLATSKGQKLKNPVAEQCNSWQGCTVKAKAMRDKAH
jgi:hypothetical protein